MTATAGNKKVDSNIYTLKEFLLEKKYSIDYYQREYVWQPKQIEDLINDLSSEILKNWDPGHTTEAVENYDPYYMGEIVLSDTTGKRSIIDGQQRLTSLTLLLIYLVKNFGDKDLPNIKEMIYSDSYGKKDFNIQVPDRQKCMNDLFHFGCYTLTDGDTPSVENLKNRYEDISRFWNEGISDDNIHSFVYWLRDKVIFSGVTASSDEFAYVIFETMNDRGLSLTYVEKLRSFILSSIDGADRNNAVVKFDNMVKRLVGINLSTQSKADVEFFKMYFRGHLAESFNQKDKGSDFVMIGNDFHRWYREKSDQLGLSSSSAFGSFLDKLDRFSKVYEKIFELIDKHDANKHLYLTVNADFKLTLQPALIMAAVNYTDTDNEVDDKIEVVSKFLTKLLVWRVWNHKAIQQSYLDTTVYDLCEKVRGKNVSELKDILGSYDMGSLDNAPRLHQQNKRVIKVLLGLITEIVARNSDGSNYLIGDKDNIEIEHIWADHYEEHVDECPTEDDFATTRNGIGCLLLLPKPINASYGDAPYEDKVKQYFSQNIIAQTLCEQKYHNNPQFLQFKERSGLEFKPYKEFTRSAISERAELYKAILLWAFQ